MSTRPMEAGLSTVAAAPNKYAFFLIELNFTSGILRLTTSGQDIEWSGQRWIGVGKIGTVEPIKEDTAIQANGYKMTLSGLDPEFVAVALDEDEVFGRLSRMWLALVDDAGVIRVLDPFVVRMDHMQIIDGQTCTVELYCETRMATWNRPRNRRFTNADQQKEFPGDLGFEFVSDISQRVLSWGRG